MGAQKWFKFYGQEYLSDPKIERLTPAERSCLMTLLCMASLTDGKIRFLTVETLLNRSGIQFDPYYPDVWEAARGVLIKMQELEIITMHDNGDITLNNWDKRQETNLTSAERVRNYRERKKDSVTDVTHDVTQPVTDVTLDQKRVDKKITANADSSPLVVVEDNPKPKKAPKDKTALVLRDELYDLFEKEYDTRPAPNMGDYTRVVSALKRIDEKKIKWLVEERIGEGKRTVREALSDRSIDVYLQDN